MVEANKAAELVNAAFRAVGTIPSGIDSADVDVVQSLRSALAEHGVRLGETKDDPQWWGVLYAEVFDSDGNRLGMSVLEYETGDGWECVSGKWFSSDRFK